MPVIIVTRDPRRATPSTSSVKTEFTYHEDDFPVLKKDLTFTIVRSSIRGTSAPALVTDTPHGDTLAPVKDVLPIEKVLSIRAFHTSFTKFMDLPTEIRELVEEHAMRNGRHFEYDLRVQRHSDDMTKALRPEFLPALCFVSKATFGEIAAVYIRNTNFLVTSIDANHFLTKFLEGIPNDAGFKSIRNMALPYFDCFPGIGNTKNGQFIEKNNDLVLVAKCSGLRTIKMSMHMKQMCKPVKEQGNITGWTVKTVPELVLYYDLEKVFACTGLRKIHWDGKSHAVVEDNVVGDLRCLLHDLAGWVEGKFRSMGTEHKGFECIVTWR